MRRWRKLRPFATRGRCRHATCLCKHTSRFGASYCSPPLVSLSTLTMSWDVVQSYISYSFFKYEDLGQLKRLCQSTQQHLPSRSDFQLAVFAPAWNLTLILHFRSLQTEERRASGGSESLWVCGTGISCLTVDAIHLLSSNPSFRPTSSPIYLYYLPS